VMHHYTSRLGASTVGLTIWAGRTAIWAAPTAIAPRKIVRYTKARPAMSEQDAIGHIREIIRTADNSPQALLGNGHGGTQVDVSAVKSNERDLVDIRSLAEAAIIALQERNA